MKQTATAIGLALATFSAGGAYAADISDKEEQQLRDAGYVEHPWQGLYVAFGVGAEIVSLDLGPVDLSEDDYLGNVRLGYDFQRGLFVGGPYAEATWHNLSIGPADSEWSYAFGGRAGVVLGNTLLYGLAEYNFREFDAEISDQEGFGAGAGAEVHFGGPFFGGIEYSHFFGEEVGDGPITADTSSDAVMLTFTIKGDPTN